MSKPFEGQAAASYLDGPPRQVPGYDALLRMVNQLLAERIPANGKILVLGAGGGLEIRSMARANPDWCFEGIDPSADMISLAAQTTVEFEDRVHLQTGYIEDASSGPVDGATCLLTMHFVPQEQRLETLRQVRSRLALGAPFVMAHISFPQTEPDRSVWIARHVAYTDTAPEKVEASRKAISERLTILDPGEEESLLTQAGFGGISLFYAGLSFRGWIAYAT